MIKVKKYKKRYGMIRQDQKFMKEIIKMENDMEMLFFGIEMVRLNLLKYINMGT